MPMVDPTAIVVLPSKQVLAANNSSKVSVALNQRGIIGDRIIVLSQLIVIVCPIVTGRSIIRLKFQKAAAIFYRACVTSTLLGQIHGVKVRESIKAFREIWIQCDGLVNIGKWVFVLLGVRMC